MSTNFTDTLYFIQQLRQGQELARRQAMAQEVAPVQQAVDKVGTFKEKLDAENEALAQKMGGAGMDVQSSDPRLMQLAQLGASAAQKAREAAAEKMRMEGENETNKLRVAHSFDLQRQLNEDPLARQVQNETGLAPGSAGYGDAYTKARLHEEQQKRDLAALHARAGMGQLTGAVPDEIVQAIGEGRMQMPVGRTLATPWGQELTRRLAASYPNFDANRFTTRKATEKDAAVGKIGQNQTSLNTLIQHLGDLDQRVGQLNNSSFSPWNAVANTVGRATDNPAVNDYDTVAGKAGDEAAKLFAGTNTALADRDQVKGQLGLNLGPASQRSAIRRLIHLAAGRANALREQYQKGMSEEPGPTLDPKSVTILRQLGIDPAEFGADLSPGAPSTNVPMPPAPSTAAPVRKFVRGPDGKLVEVTQ